MPPTEQSGQAQEPLPRYICAGERKGDAGVCVGGVLSELFSVMTRHAGSLGSIPLKPAG